MGVPTVAKPDKPAKKRVPHGGEKISLSLNVTFLTKLANMDEGELSRILHAPDYALKLWDRIASFSSMDNPDHVIFVKYSQHIVRGVILFRKARAYDLNITKEKLVDLCETIGKASTANTGLFNTNHKWVSKMLPSIIDEHAFETLFRPSSDDKMLVLEYAVPEQSTRSIPGDSIKNEQHDMNDTDDQNDDDDDANSDDNDGDDSDSDASDASYEKTSSHAKKHKSHKKRSRRGDDHGRRKHHKRR